MTVKSTMFFEENVGTNAYGWSESHYDLQSAGLVPALTALKKLAKLRARLLGGGVTITKIRVSDPNVFRDSLIDDGPISTLTLRTEQVSGQLMMSRVADGAGNIDEPFGGSKLQPLVGAAPTTLALEVLASMPTNAVLIRMEGGTTFQSRKSMILRGIPEGVIKILFTGQSLNTTAVGSAWATEFAFGFLKELKSGQWGFRALDQSPANPYRNPAFLTIVANGVFTLTATANQPNIGDTIRIQGAKIVGPVGSTNPKVNGLWTVMTKDITGTVFTFVNGQFPPGAYTTLNVGRYRLQTPAYLAYNNAVDIRYTKRNTGSPFFRPVGRAKKRVSAR